MSQSTSNNNANPIPQHWRWRTHHHVTCSGPFSFLNPTTRKFPLPLQKVDKASHTDENGQNGANKGTRPPAKATGYDEIKADEVYRNWRSRDNRKGRHAITVIPQSSENPKYRTPPSTSTLKQTIKGIGRMFTYYPYWDISYLVAYVFTWGSIVWVLNAFFVWLPLEIPSSEFTNEITYGGGITAFIGATIFEFGSVLLMIEAVNENRSDCFGWALEEAFGEDGVIHLRPGRCNHHHRNHGNLVGKASKSAASSQTSLNDGSSSDRSWTWWPSWHELRTHYFHEIGFLACLSQMIGATIFWIAGFTALPPIYDDLTSTAAQNGAYWLPQVIGGSGFITSGTLFMLETQKKWYIPAPKVLGWHIGLWNLIGGIGFTLCGALGFASANSGCVYQGSLATFWGSWCFLIGSLIQLYESLQKHPVEVKKKDDGSKST